MYLSLYCKGSKRVTQGFTVRGSWRPNRTAIYWPPLLWPSALCLSRYLGLLNRRHKGLALCWMMAFFAASYQQPLWAPTHQGLQGPPPPGFLYHILSATFLDSNSSGAPSAPSAWCGFPYHISSNSVRSLTQSGAPRSPSARRSFLYHISSPTPTVWLLVLTELYYSSTPTQSCTQSLEWHVWLSSSGNNCHAVQRSLSSGASVYECIMGFFTLSHFVSQYPPTRFLSITGHWDVSLPSGASLWNDIFGRVEGQNTTIGCYRGRWFEIGQEKIGCYRVW